MSLRLAMPTTTFTIGQPIAVAIYLPAPAITTTAGEQLGGYSLVLNFDPTVLRVVDVVWQERNAHTLRLGPLLSAETGQLQLGAHGVVPQTYPTEPLVTVHFAAHGEGNTAITATRVEAVDGQGRTVAATVVPNNGQLTIQSQQSFLPLVQQ